MMQAKKLLESPTREYLLALVLVIGLLDHYAFSHGTTLLWVTALLGSILPFQEALNGLRERTITIELFNFLALFASFVTGEITSASFIALMLTFASYLDWRTESRASNAVEELLKLKPNKAYREANGEVEEIASDDVVVGDILVVKTGERIPVDGTIVFGEGNINEASITGESVPVEKGVGDEVYSSTLSETGVIKIKATKVGSDSTISRMAKLIADAHAQKSKAQRLADRFATIFLPVVVLVGIGIYLVTHDLSMTVAFFLVVCADDIAVSIPLAVTASLGFAAKRGVIIKGGEWLDKLAKIDTLVFDKTGTLTYGNFELASSSIIPTYDETTFWKYVGAAEKLSEHPTGRAILRFARKHADDIPDPTDIIVHKGSGVSVSVEGHKVSIGNERLVEELGLSLADEDRRLFDRSRADGHTVMMVFVDQRYVGMLAIADTPRGEARASIKELRDLGIRVVMLTGDNEAVARRVAGELGIEEFRAGVTPEGKLIELTELGKKGVVGMVGDGVNDAPALARADIGIAMGSGGTAVAVETANIVILTDQIDRVPELIVLARRTVSVVNLDMGIWFMTNALGVILVFMGVLGPALAAFYNFLTDFLPLLNSARLFNNKSPKA